MPGTNLRPTNGSKTVLIASGHLNEPGAQVKGTRRCVRCNTLWTVVFNHGHPDQHRILRNGELIEWNSVILDW